MRLWFPILLLILHPISIIQSETELIVRVNGPGVPPNGKNMTMIVAGRGGTGITTSIRRIVGPGYKILEPVGPSTPITEILVPIPCEPGFFKIVDVDGLVRGKSTYDDDLTIAALETYLRDPSGMNGSQPDFFLLVSDFNDYKLNSPEYSFPKTLSKIAEVQISLYNSTIPNTAVLVTSVMRTVSKTDPFSPQKRLDEFSESIKNFTKFNDQKMEIFLGENFGSNYNLHVEVGNTELPNGDRYPENILNRLIEIASEVGDSDAVRIMTKFRDARRPASIQSHTFRPTDKIDGHQLNIFKDSQLPKLGRGYHMLKELVLDTTPFKYVKRDFDQLEYCKHIRARRFDTLNEYVKHRLDVKFGMTSVPERADEHFEGRVMAGNIISGVTDTVEMEIVEIPTWKHYVENVDRSQLSPDFIDAFSVLPSFHPLDPKPDCEGRRKWRDFFERFGTHYVEYYEAVFAEERKISQESKSFNLTQNEGLECELCTDDKMENKFGKFPPTSCNGIDFSIDNFRGAYKPSFEFGKVGDLLSPKEGASFQNALFQLTLNNLACDHG